MWHRSTMFDLQVEMDTCLTVLNVFGSNNLAGWICSTCEWIRHVSGGCLGFTSNILASWAYSTRAHIPVSPCTDVHHMEMQSLWSLNAFDLWPSVQEADAGQGMTTCNWILICSAYIHVIPIDCSFLFHILGNKVDASIWTSRQWNNWTEWSSGLMLIG